MRFFAVVGSCHNHDWNWLAWHPIWKLINYKVFLVVLMCCYLSFGFVSHFISKFKMFELIESVCVSRLINLEFFLTSVHTSIVISLICLRDGRDFPSRNGGDQACELIWHAGLGAHAVQGSISILSLIFFDHCFLIAECGQFARKVWSFIFFRPSVLG